MGVNLKELTNPKEITLKELAHSTIAIDAFNQLYQFLASIRLSDGTELKNSKGETTSHLVGLLARTTTLLEHNITPIYVFDGISPELKAAERLKRGIRKTHAQEKYEQAKQTGNIDEMKKYAQQTSKLTTQHITEAKHLLRLLGVQTIDAPSEAEAQAAYMAQQGIVDYCASQDYDALLFGTPKLIRHLNSTGKRKIAGTSAYKSIQPEIITLKEVRETNNLTQEQLINLAILLGTDFNTGGVKGIGPKNALKKVQEHPKREELLQHINWGFEQSFEDVYNTIAHMPVEKNIELIAPKQNPEALTEYLQETCEFSESRIENTLKKLANKTAQTGLKQFF